MKRLPWRNAQRLTPLGEFNDIETTFAALDLRNEGLRVSKPLTNLRLCEASFGTPRLEEFEQRLIAAVVSGLSHTVAGRWHRKLESVLE